MSWFPKTETIPVDPGVYRWFDANGRILYVGKAKNLRARLTSYFGKPESLHERTRRMVASAVRIDWTIVGSEFEALQLEFTWIKEFNPPFNVQFRDDKSYPYLAVSLDETYPRVFITRNRKPGKTRYFGPYTQAWSVRETIDGLLKVFPMRSCSSSVFDAAKRSNRPCLLADVGKCSAPCVGKVTQEQHLDLAKRFANFVGGSDTALIVELGARMKLASEAMQYELAAKLRDQIGALEAVRAKSAVVFSDSTSADVVAVSQDGYSVAVTMFIVREGRIRGANGWILDLELERSIAEVIEFTLENLYLGEDGQELPKELIVSELPESVGDLERLLGNERGSKVEVRLPKRGDKRALMETALKNAEHSLKNYKLKRATDFSARSVALSNLQEALGLPNAPLTIECFDVSHLAGTNIVASKVVFVDGKPAKNLYRRYTLADATDDTDAMNQTLERRFRAISLGEKAPDLIVVDGAKPQVNAAIRAAKAYGLDSLKIIGIAKRLEELWSADDDFPILLPRSSEELFMVQHLRDEAHRFAIAHQRLKRTATISSVLEEIPGVGAQKVAMLLKHFGSVKRVKQATVAELHDLPGIGLVLATQIHEVLNK